MDGFNDFSKSTPKHKQEFIGITNMGNKALYEWLKNEGPRRIFQTYCPMCKTAVSLFKEDEYLVGWK